MLCLLEVLGDPRGYKYFTWTSRGNHVYEIHKFVISKIAYHSRNLTPENQNLLDELLECLAKEDVLRFQKMTFMELKP